MKHRRTPEATRLGILTLGLHVLARHPGSRWALTMTPRTAGIWLEAQLRHQGRLVTSGDPVMEPALSGRFVLRISPGHDGEVLAVLRRLGPPWVAPPSYHLDLTTDVVTERPRGDLVVPAPRRSLESG